VADQIRIEIDDEQALRALQRAAESGRDLSPVMRDIAGVIEDAIERAFQTQSDPETGEPWAPLAESTKKKRSGSEPFAILQDSSSLVQSIGSDFDATSAEAGVAEIYGVTHQFGAEKGEFGTAQGAFTFDGQSLRPRSIPIPWGDIPARPFLGLSDEDETEILDLVSAYLSDSFST